MAAAAADAADAGQLLVRKPARKRRSSRLSHAAKRRAAPDDGEVAFSSPVTAGKRKEFAEKMAAGATATAAGKEVRVHERTARRWAKKLRAGKPLPSKSGGRTQLVHPDELEVLKAICAKAESENAALSVEDFRKELLASRAWRRGPATSSL